jgi:DNA-binding NarL/FixJ family response regulator
VAHTAVVVDDHGPTRAVVRRLVELAGADVVGEAADLAGTLAVVERLRPTVLVIDVQLPDGTGIDAARMISARPSPPRIVLMSTGDYAAVAGRCGAHAFIPKDQLSVTAFIAAFE